MGGFRDIDGSVPLSIFAMLVAVCLPALYVSLALFIALVAVAALLVLGPWHYSERSGRRMLKELLDRDDRLRWAAEVLPCPSCGGPLGVAALQASDERWLAHVAELVRAHPGGPLNLERIIHAVCTSCGARLHFGETSGTFGPSEATA